MMGAVIGVTFSPNDFKSTKQGAALQLALKFFIMAVQIYVLIFFFINFFFLVERKRDRFLHRRISMRNYLTIFLVCFMIALFHLNIFSMEILKVLILLDRFKTPLLRKIVGLQNYFISPCVDFLIALTFLYLFYYQGVSNE